MVPGAVVGRRFVIQSLAGKGGMSEVHRAIDERTGRTVALKIFLEREDKPDDGDQSTGRFDLEAEVLAGMGHPSIVEHVAHGVSEDGVRYLAMEWLEGEDLSVRLARGPLSIADATTVVRRIASALGAAHARGVVHRDVKPSNVFLSGFEIAGAKLIDFGIARVRGGARFTKHGEALGTPAYMAPEQARGAREIDAPADVFSLGCVFFECLVGRPPFWADHPLAVMAKILLDETPPVAELRPDVPAPLVQVLNRMLAKDPAARPGDGRAVVELLDGLGRAAGAAAPASKAPSSLTARERQLLSVVFVGRVPHGVRDARSLDEDTATPMFVAESKAAVDGVYATVLKHGGWAERLVDGTLVVTLPGRGPLLDQVAQSARCALSVRAAMPRHPMVMATGRADLSGGFPVGDVLDRGVRLLSAELDRGRQRQGIVIDEVTAGLLDRRFVVTGASPGLELTAERDARDGRGETLFLGKPQPCVGRTRETARLVGLFEAVANDHSAQAVIVTAASGMGKTRLRRELCRKLESRHPAPTIIVARGDAARAGVPLGLAASAIADLIGLREGEGADVSRHRVRARLGRHVARSERDRVAVFLGELVGVPFPDDAHPMLVPARKERVRMGDQIRAAWEELFAAELAQGCVAVVLEDLHHADPPSVALFDSMLRTFSDAPLFVVGFARSELDDAFPELWAQRPLLRFDLAPLSRSAQRELIVQALGDAATDALVERVIQQADGNAFYLEEIVRAVAEGRGDRLPETVVAMIEARLETFDAEDRRVLRAASILGAGFTPSAVAHLLGAAASEDVSERLLGMVERELLIRRGTTASGEIELAFRSVPVRTAAYATLTEEDRALGHRLAAERLERGGAMRDAELIAEHFDRAGEERRAAIWYAHAAESSLQANDFAAVIERGERGALAGAAGPLLGRIRLLQAEAHRHVGDNAGMEARAVEASKLLPARTPPWWTATADAVLGSIRLGKREQVVRLAAEILGSEIVDPPAAATRAAHYLHFAGLHEAAERLLHAALANIGDFEVDPAKWAWGYRAFATRALLGGDLGRYLEQLELAVRAFEVAGDVREAASERANLGFARAELGLFTEAEGALRDALAGAERLGLRHVVGAAQQNLGAVLFRSGRPDAGRSLLELARARFAEQKNQRMEGNTHTYLAELHLAAGDLDLALDEASRAVELLSDVPPLLPVALAIQARICLAAGDVRAALPRAKDAVAMLGVSGSDEGESLVRLVLVEALRAAGSPEVEAALGEAKARLLARAEKITDPAWRESFLVNVEPNRRTLELADKLGV
jgi:tetratricopeptide (TPR) repeat protein